jgi:hypothetical protein
VRAHTSSVPPLLPEKALVLFVVGLVGGRKFSSANWKNGPLSLPRSSCLSLNVSSLHTDVLLLAGSVAGGDGGQ